MKLAGGHIQLFFARSLPGTGQANIWPMNRLTNNKDPDYYIGQQQRDVWIIFARIMANIRLYNITTIDLYHGCTSYRLAVDMTFSDRFEGANLHIGMICGFDNLFYSWHPKSYSLYDCKFLSVTPRTQHLHTLYQIIWATNLKSSRK